ERVGARPLAADRALVDRGVQRSVKVASTFRQGPIAAREPIKEIGGHAAAYATQRLVLVRECVGLALIFFDRGELYVFGQFSLDIDCGRFGKRLRALFWKLRGQGATWVGWGGERT